jgi:hydrogenase maturation protease
VLVFGWGNLSRGDDALGPLFVQALSAAGTDGVELLEDYQLQIEHALDLRGRERVLFVDASLSCAAPFEVTLLRAVAVGGVTTHALSPEAVMGVYRKLYAVEPPPCTLLAIRGDRFGLGEPPGATALSHLVKALDWACFWLDAGRADGDDATRVASVPIRRTVRRPGS